MSFLRKRGSDVSKFTFDDLGPKFAERKRKSRVFAALLVKKSHSGGSQNPVAMNYKKSIVAKWIQDVDFVNAKALTKSISGMTRIFS